MRNMQRFTVYPKTHYATTRERVLAAVETIKVELKERLEQLYAENKLVEAQRLAQRTQFDIEMMAEVGFCNGIENYSRHLTGKNAGEPPPTLFDYLPPDALLVIDESLAQGDPGRVRIPPAVGTGQPTAAFRGMGGALPARDLRVRHAGPV